MSLWNVSDQATSLMMRTFYSNLVKGKGKRESFSAAQKEVRKKYNDDPYYWAVFRSCLKFFLRMFETCFCAGFCRFLRRIAALLCDKNGRKMPE